MNVVVEVAASDDLAEIRTLDGLPATNARLLDRDVGAPDRCCLVARHGGEVVGYGSATIHLGEAEVLDVVVDPAWRRRGIATRLLTELARQLRARGVTVTTLEVREGSVGTQALYRHLGFTVEGRRPGYYSDGEAALIMWQRT